MNITLQKLKPWMLPIAMLAGALFHKPIEAVQWLVPYLIFTMLLITFCRVSIKEFTLGRMIWQMLAVQIVGSVAVFIALRPLSLPMAQSVMLCIICPTATAAPVVTGMLGGSIGRVASYSIVSNITAAVVAPILFVWAGADSGISFFDEFLTIVMRVAPLIVLPLGIAFTLNFAAPRLHRVIASAQSASFYLWSVSLLLVVGRSVSFVLSEPPTAIPLMIGMTIGALTVCCFQFAVGRKIGRAAGDAVSAAQGLGQKNTVLAVWMALNYLNPIASVGPAAYIAWQNTINSAQLYIKMRRQAKTSASHVEQ